MSRLDDELRNAFSREQPPSDFTERLLARVAQQPARQPRWWQRLAMLLEPPKLRWVAIGVTAALLLAIGAAQLNRVRQVAAGDSSSLAKTEPAPEAGSKASVNPDDGHPRQDAATADPKLRQRIKRAAPSSTDHRLATVRLHREEELRVEGEAAKEKLMLALSIASSALSDAQKAVHDDGLNP